MDTLLSDLRYAARTFRQKPGFTAVAVITLALGIGANTAMFSVVNGVLIEPLPFDEPDRLYSVRGGMSVRGEFAILREEVESFSQIALFNPDDELSLTGSGDPIRVAGAAVSPGLFSLLGAEPALGRTFSAAAERPGGGRVVILSHGLWQRRFGSDPGIIGRAVRLDGESRTVVGVMPPGFDFPAPTVQLWTPVVMDPADRATFWGSGGYYTIARLRRGVTPERARAELRSLGPRMHEVVPWRMPPDTWRSFSVVRVKEELVGSVRPMLLVLLGAVGLILLIACVNVANLMLVRATARRHELAIRTALGAGRGRLARQLLTESTLLAAVGGVVGLILAAWGVELLTTVLPADLPRAQAIGIDGRVLGFSAALTFATGIAFGLLPALRASSDRGVRGALSDGGRGSATGPERRRLSGALVATEIALAVILVIGAGLLIKSFWQRLQVHPGFRTERLVTATISPPTFRYRDDAALRAFYDDLLTRLESRPGIQAAAVTSQLPFGGRNYGNVFLIDGRPDPSETGDWPYASASPVMSSDYLRTMGVPLLRGRGFTGADRVDAGDVVIINERLAREYWPDQDALGQRVRYPGDEAWRTVVGVVADVKRARLSEEVRSAIYMPLSQAPASRVEVVRVAMRTTSDAAVAATTLREVIASVDPDTPVSDIRTMRERISAAVATPRFTMLLLAGFAGLALLLGAIGIYGVIAYTVSRRTREIGIRMALGAGTGDVLGMVVRHGAVLGLVGVTLGLVAALGATRFLSSMLYGVSATDPLTFAAVAVLLAGVAVLASYIPARRVTRVDPVTALRRE